MKISFSSESQTKSFSSQIKGKTLQDVSRYATSTNKIKIQFFPLYADAGRGFNQVAAHLNNVPSISVSKLMCNIFAKELEKKSSFKIFNVPKQNENK